MGKRNKQGFVPRPEAVAKNAERDGLSRRGKKTIVAGLFGLLIGFLVLSRADAMGRNWAATLSPFLILGSYAAIGVGIFLPDPADPSLVFSAEKTIKAP